MAQSFATRPEIHGRFGAVASTHWIASSVGMSMLERGGNAFDAATAAGFVLQILSPHLNGPGGEVPMILQRPQDSEPIVICGQGGFPALATTERIRSLGLGQMPGTGLLPAVVPGAFDAWMLLLRDYGTLRLRDVLENVIAYARGGFPTPLRTATCLLAAKAFFQADWPTSSAAWLPHGEVPRPGSMMTSPMIADTYERLLLDCEAHSADRDRQIERARDVFYRGFVAEAIDGFYRTACLVDSSGRANPGLLRGDDLARYRASTERTVSLTYRGWTVHKTGPWGQGPVLLQTLALLDGFDLDAMDPEGEAFVHTVVECMKLSYADREVFYGDPAFLEVPLDRLLSADYARERRALVGQQASLEMRPGDLPGAADRMARVMAMAGAETPAGLGGGEPTYAPIPVEWGDTVHLDVVDHSGNMISATPSGGWLQGSPAVPGLGFSVTTRGQMCWLEEGHPTSLRPGARPRTTLTPTLVTRDGAACLAMGTPGGDQQDQWTLVAFLRHVHHTRNLQATIDAPSFHIRHFPQSFYPRAAEPGHVSMEGRFRPDVVAGLERRGHRVRVENDWALGRVCAVSRRDSEIRAAADARLAAADARLMEAYAIGR